MIIVIIVALFLSIINSTSIFGVGDPSLAAACWVQPQELCYRAAVQSASGEKACLPGVGS